MEKFKKYFEVIVGMLGWIINLIVDGKIKFGYLKMMIVDEVDELLIDEILD